MLRNIVREPLVWLVVFSDEDRHDRDFSNLRPVTPTLGFCSIRSRLKNGFQLVLLKGIRATGMNGFVLYAKEVSKFRWHRIFERRSRSDAVELFSSVPACFVAAAEREHHDWTLQRAHVSD
ncbi:hypothetical protein SISSUDRAFT_1056358 [Sistotremastrum suecicum HHB10207 ss-3]|uniref:Uncharacterized protein n=1 Tax=Sistotremastrum suecicum HHB10207 ss-3 TaxID=1314776 RepID=A0A165WZH9_9AGAM|nr:hypothetical protein SISSUDRAFT_1056358 [Sistotremastrum suecicum HHB10207 ss-3]